MIITIDGPSVSGKGTTARALAQKLDVFYLDTGSLYRAVGYVVSQEFTPEQCTADHITGDIVTQYLHGIVYNYTDNGVQLSYNGSDITHHLRTSRIDNYSSRVSAIPVVRKALRGLQQQLGSMHSLVIDGRDCGSVIFPHAQHKFFLTARLSVRVARLLGDNSRGNGVYQREQAQEDVMTRDIRDIARSLSPLVAPSDARIIDNSNLTLDETVAYITRCINT